MSHRKTKQTQEPGRQPDEQGQNQEVDIEKLAEDLACLQKELDTIRADAEQSRDLYLRTLADFDNYRKRQREETLRQVNGAREDLVGKLLPVVDNFQRAIESAEAGHSFDALVEGVTLTLRQLAEILEREGLEPIEAVGQQFNPELHEAVMSVETDEYPENTIVEEFEKGYTINGRVLRPSKVRVARSA